MCNLAESEVVSSVRSYLSELGVGKLLKASFLCGLLCSSAKPQTSATAQFEVASVRENVSHSTSSAISTSSPDRLMITNVPLRFLVLYAYDLPDHRLAGMPAWSEERAFDVRAVYPQGERPSDHAIRVMVQNLLVDRFGLKFHREERQLAAYDLEVLRGNGQVGPQMKAVQEDCSGTASERRAETGAQASRDDASSSSGKESLCSIAATRKKLWGGAATLAQLAATIQAMVGRPVLDRTGLAGRYDITLHWAPTQLRADSNADGGSAEEEPSIFTALREQLGLKLVSRKEAFDVLVVESIAMPSRD